MAIESENLKSALAQWRDSLVNLTGRNRLLNYRPTRSSTIEFARASAPEVFATISSAQLTYVVGTRPSDPATGHDSDVNAETLEDLVLDELSSFNYEDHPDSLFADMTQRNVDRALKTMAGVARREYLDKGLSTLYLALGALRWTDDSGDTRKSPLILLPASLESPGPRQPLYLALSEDDMSVNPALAIKLAEYAIELPTAESVSDAIDNGGIGSALGLFSALKMPDDWAVEDFSTLSNFMFAKEAMYRDLLDNEEAILGHNGLRALAGDVRPEDSQFAFDEVELDNVDAVAPPETTPLILDADASQRAAIAAANAGKSFVMDGPPGTGKSQTIANMIGTLVNQGKSVLFVSEKIVALEVVRDRLATRGLDPFTLELHSHKAVRSEVAKQLGAAIQMRPVPPARPAPERLENAKAARQALSDYAMGMNELRRPLELSLFDVLGRITALSPQLAPPPCQVKLKALDPSSLTQLTGNFETLSRHWTSALEGERALWSGLQKQPASIFDFRAALDSLQALKALEPATSETAAALGLDGLQSVRRLHQTLETWQQRPQSLNVAWLVEDLIPKSQALERYSQLLSASREADSEAERVSGQNWRDLPTPDVDTTHATEQWQLLNIRRDELTVARVETLADYLARAHRLGARMAEASAVLSTQLGMHAPATPIEHRAVIDAARLLLGDARPLVVWLTDDHARAQASDALIRLRHRIEEERIAEAAATTVFTPGILDLDIDALIAALPVGAGMLKRLSRDYRTSQATALAAAVPAADPKKLAEALHLARQWRDSRRALQESVAVDAAALGPFYAGRDTEWDRAKRALDNAHTVAGIVNIVNVPALTHASSNEANRELLKPVLDDLDTAFAQWATLRSANGETLTPVAAAGSVQSTIETIDTLRADAEVLHGTLSEFSHHLGPNVTVPLITAAVSARESAARAEAALTLALPEVAAVLGCRPEDLPDTRSGVDTLGAHLRWAQDFQALRADAATETPLSRTDLQSLVDSYLPSALHTAIDDWEQQRDSVLNLFDAHRGSELRSDFADFRSAEELLNEFIRDYDSANDWEILQQTLTELRNAGLAAPLDYAITTRVPASDIAAYLIKSVYETWFAAQVAADPRLKVSAAVERDGLTERFRELDRELRDAAVSTIVESAAQRRPRSTVGQAGIILREAEKKRKHIPVRELISRARDVIQSVHPCFMMSPLAVSQYLPADIKFDVVIFDEASQVSPGDAINCVYRGNALITVGDQKQLPPTSFFTSSEDVDEDSDEENLASDYESILDLMKASGSFNSLTLRWHYRSRHEDLISYSNASFYEGRLITFPGAIADSERFGVKFHKVNGVYRRSAGRDNPIEAEYVAQRVLNHFDTRPEASLGVVAFSSAQRDTIENAITLARAERPDLDGYFQDDRVDGFFVKSLESVQGDERDVIIFSVGYGPDETGKFYRQFGPVNMAGGQRRLNVAVTRARELVELVSSVTSADIGDVTSEGARHLRRYLDFAERGQAALALELGPNGLGTDSPFEDAVIDSIRSWGFEVQPQVGVAGYRIDIGVKHPNAPGAFMLGVECDGAMYHSSRTARDRDRLRHEILEGLGWTLHHIWGTAWYRNRAKEEQRLRELLERLAEEPMTARVRKPRNTERVAPIVVSVEENEISAIPSWVVEYSEADPEPLPSWLDLGERGSHHHLVDFVRSVTAVEAPVHMDLVAQRLRSASGVGRLGGRIQENLKAAIAQAGASLDGQFLRSTDERRVDVRRPSAWTDRSVEQVPPEELSAAIIGVVKDARGISVEETSLHVASIFGWQRRGPTITGQIQTRINALCEDQKLVLTLAGLRIVDEST